MPSRGRLRFCSILEYHLRDIVISLVLDIYGLFKMVMYSIDCGLFVVAFEVVVEFSRCL